MRRGIPNIGRVVSALLGILLSAGTLFSAAAPSASGQGRVDARAVRLVLHVDAQSKAASDANPGTMPARPLKTIQRAVDLAAGKPCRIRIHPGTYREYIRIAPGDGPLILEATESGKAVVSGADPVRAWRAEWGGAFSFAWTNRWGLNGDQWYFPGERTAYNLRREIVFLNGKRLRQRCRPGKEEGPVPAADLKPGEFTVDESAGRILFRPPSGTTLRLASRLEVSVRGYAPGKYPEDGQSLITVQDHGNVEIRGIRVEAACNYILANPALSISGSGGRDPARWPANFVLADCSFSHNNGVGLGLSGVRDISIVRCSMSDNGERGGGAGGVRNLLVSDTRFFDNGWRFGPWLVGHDMAGFKLFDGATSDSWFRARSQGVRFVRCQFRGNLCHNLWQDFGPQGTRVDSCLFEDSPYTAIMQEVTPGPLIVTDTVIRRCGLGGSAAMLVVASPDVRLDRCILYNSGSTEKGGALLEMIGDTRTTDPSAENRITRLHITHSILQANRPNTYLFRTGAWNGAVDARKDFAETAVTEDNVFFCADRPKEGLDLYKRGEVSFFSPTLLTGNDGWRNGYPDLTLDEWRKLPSASGALRDQRSRWKESSVTVLDRLDPLKRKR